MKKKPKLLILYASAGAGHMQAASALKRVCDETGTALAEDIDILSFTPAYFKRFYSGGYLEVVKRVPELWGYLYDRSYKYKTRTAIARIHNVMGNIYLARVLKYVRDFRPDALVFTHFLGWEALGSLRRLRILNIPFYCVVTDFAIHSFWINDQINIYYVATEGIRRVLRHHGFKDKQIRITGIPVNPPFAEQFNKKKLRHKLKLDPDLPTVLMISGRYNLSGFEQLLASFKDVKDKMQILALAGRHKILQYNLANIAKGLKHRVVVYTMVENMPELMGASDIVVTKPGGLTTSEILACRRLMAIIDPIPGQELRNSDYLLESGVAIRIHDMENGGLKIADLLRNERRLNIMKRHLRWISRPRAAYNIVKDIISDLR